MSLDSTAEYVYLQVAMGLIAFVCRDTVLLFYCDVDYSVIFSHASIGLRCGELEVEVDVDVDVVTGMYQQNRTTNKLYRLAHRRVSFE